MTVSQARRPQALLLSALLALLCAATLSAYAQANAEAPSSQCSGYYYTVRSGETWSIIARRVGAPVTLLKAANPQAVRPRDLIYPGEKLCIPSQGEMEQGGYWYQVKPGDTWNKVARATGVPVQQLMDANRQLVNRRLWLYLGQRIWVPAATATATPAASPAPLPTASPTITPTVSSAAVVPATPAASPQALATPVQPTATLPPLPADCPKTMSGYGDAVASYLNKAGNTPATLQAWLVACRAVSADKRAVTVAPITGPNAADVIAILHDPLTTDANAQELLLVYHRGTKGYSLAHKHEGQGPISLVQAADVNTDGKVDIVYSDRSCGAHTCFGTLFVDSWNGRAYQDWVTDEPTIAFPEITIKDVATEGQGSEIVVHGGVIGSVGAGPQRAWTETYTSPNGAPYVLFSQVYDPSTCLYFKIVDANRALDAWALNGFDPAIEAYNEAIADQAAESCGTIADEVATLRDFARFRLLIVYAASGRATEGLSLPSQITNQALKGAATTFLNSYRANNSIIQACRDTNKYAQTNSGSWQFLADWGYANPSFTAQDLCPLD